MTVTYPIVYRHTRNGWKQCEIKDLVAGDVVQMIHPDDRELYPTLLEVTKDAEKRWMEKYEDWVWDFFCLEYHGEITYTGD